MGSKRKRTKTLGRKAGKPGSQTRQDGQKRWLACECGTECLVDKTTVKVTCSYCVQRSTLQDGGVA